MRQLFYIVSCLVFAAVAQVQAETITLAAGEGQALLDPFAVAFDADGNMYVSQMGPNQIRKVDTKGTITLFAGTGEKAHGGDGGPADKAKLGGPHHILMGHDGNLYVADTWNSRVRKIDLKTGVITTFAGTGVKGFGGDGGPADKAQVGNIYCLAFDAKVEHLYLDDLDNRRIRVIDLKTGIISTAAGNGQKGIPKDGDDAKSSPLQDPRAITVDSKGNLYIIERAGHSLRVVDPNGRIKTIAGIGKAGPCGEGGEALKTAMNGPKHLCVDAEDNVIIADTENHSILKFTPKDGKITHIAGTGKKGSAGVGGDPKKCELNRPHGVYLDKSGMLFISDSENNRVLKIK